MRRTKATKPKLVQEMYGGELYEYYPLGKYIVAAPGVCGGRPTFKYTRLEVSMILALIESGVTIEQAVKRYSRSKITVEAVKEAIQLARRAFESSALTLQPAG
jgi:uncharacterized protein (DUF433 family)